MTNNQTPEYLSEEAYNKFESELNCLKKDKRKELSLRLEAAIAQGDLSENAEYEEAKEAQLNNENRISDLEDLLSRAVVLTKEENQPPPSIIEIGCLVILQKAKTDETLDYHIVSPGEADVLNQKISSASPLGACLLGKKRGENVEVVTPNGKIEYTIVEINY